MKLTPWFNGRRHKPTRRGVYMLYGCEFKASEVGYQYWDGIAWGPWSLTANSAKANKGSYADDSFQHDNWRGVLK